MGTDLSHWTRLVVEIDHLRAIGGALSQQQFDLQGRRDHAMRELGLIERQRSREFGERPAPGETLESARRRSPPPTRRRPW